MKDSLPFLLGSLVDSLVVLVRSCMAGAALCMRPILHIKVFTKNCLALQDKTERDHVKALCYQIVLLIVSAAKT